MPRPFTPGDMLCRRRYLREWDMLCVTRHLGAVANSIATPEELDDFVLMKDETPLHFLRLAGISDAPGLQFDVAQRCRMAFTNKDRLVFTQVGLILFAGAIKYFSGFVGILRYSIGPKQTLLCGESPILTLGKGHSRNRRCGVSARDTDCPMRAYKKVILRSL